MQTVERSLTQDEGTPTPLRGSVCMPLFCAGLGHSSSHVHSHSHGHDEGGPRRKAGST